MFKERVRKMIITFFFSNKLNYLQCYLLFIKGLTLLKVRIAAWRYDRGTRSLEQNLLNNEPKSLDIKSVQNVEEDDDEDIPPLLEDIIQELIEGLKDTDIIVR